MEKKRENKMCKNEIWIREAFFEKKERKAFIPFVTAGDPDLETTKRMLCAMEEAGASLIEIGIPFSDPVAEGPVIQAANERALAAGATTDKLFDMVKEIREKVKVPLVFMTYLNPIFTYGTEKFMRKCQEVGIQGVIVPDLPYEEKAEIEESCERYGIVNISLIAPTSKERIAMIAREARGFVYCVSSLGVTGVRSQIQSSVKKMVDEVHRHTDIPCAVGFGIATKEQAKEIGEIADGVIVGSAIVDMVAREGSEAEDRVRVYVEEMVHSLRKEEKVR